MAEPIGRVGAATAAPTQSAADVPLPLRAMVWASGAALIAMCIAIVCEAILRKAANVSLGGVNEITGYVFAVTTAWALPYALWVRANVRIDAFYTKSGTRLRLMFELLALVSIAVFFGYLTFRVGAHAIDSFLSDRRSNTSLQTPLAVPQLLWLAGMGVQMITVGVLGFKMGSALVAGKPEVAIAVMASGTEEDVAGSKVSSAQKYSLETQR